VKLGSARQLLRQRTLTQAVQSKYVASILRVPSPGTLAQVVTFMNFSYKTILGDDQDHEGQLTQRMRIKTLLLMW